MQHQDDAQDSSLTECMGEYDKPGRKTDALFTARHHGLIIGRLPSGPVYYVC